MEVGAVADKAHLQRHTVLGQSHREEAIGIGRGALLGHLVKDIGRNEFLPRLAVSDKTIHGVGTLGLGEGGKGQKAHAN